MVIALAGLEPAYLALRVLAHTGTVKRDCSEVC